MATVIANSLFRKFVGDDEWWGEYGYYTCCDIKYNDEDKTVEFSGGVVRSSEANKGETMETFFKRWMEARK